LYFIINLALIEVATANTAQSNTGLILERQSVYSKGIPIVVIKCDVWGTI